MSTGLIDIMKRASMEAQDSQQPCDLRFGTVTSVKPLKVQITNQFILPESLLIVPQHLTDYEVEVTIPKWETLEDEGHTHSYSGSTQSASGGSGESSFASHSHGLSITTKKDGKHIHVIDCKNKMTVHNALKVGDHVALIRKTGGQSYYILDRI